jgi:hypothetical protein
MKDSNSLTIVEANRVIGTFLNFKPAIEYDVVSDKGNHAYSADPIIYSHPVSMKAECERWLSEQLIDYPEGWIAKGSYSVQPSEYYPNFHSDWNHLMNAVKTLELRGVTVNITTDINATWKELLQKCLHYNKLK